MPQKATPTPSYAFPQDLLDAQATLTTTQAAYEQYIHAPAPAAGPEDEQRVEELARYRADLHRLSIEVVVHPFWSTLERGTVVAARMALKHVHGSDGGQGQP
ncbi:hypothetical protein ACFWH1_08910 [Streptomyces sp. NPDC127037]|uniref:hypothetical protein n=1 Tax=Streptomyces sp. NPDC127037 TaxID=3347113 RepID=UPI0036664A23